VSKEKTEAAPVDEAPHPLQPLHDQLSGTQHNASSAVASIEAFIKAEIEKLRAELHPKAFAKVEGQQT
jgi:hypothetical protein